MHAGHTPPSCYLLDSPMQRGRWDLNMMHVVVVVHHVFHQRVTFNPTSYDSSSQHLQKRVP